MSEALRVVEGVAATGGLVARGLGKRYKKRPVVRNVSISVKRGEAVGLLGPNGAGKTTTFYMITGLVQPDEVANAVLWLCGAGASAITGQAIAVAGGEVM